MSDIRKIPPRTSGTGPDPVLPADAGVFVAGTVGPAVEPAVGRGVDVGAAMLFAMLAEQITRAPPPFVELLHWLIVTPAAEDDVPVAVQVSWTSVPPFAEPLHWVIVAPVVVAGKGSQPIVMPSPEPTHWFTVAAVELGLAPTKLFVTLTLQRSVPPAPLVALLHCVTLLTGAFRFFVTTVQAAVGTTAASRSGIRWRDVAATRQCALLLTAVDRG
jgi:hypothetical protein